MKRFTALVLSLGMLMPLWPACGADAAEEDQQIAILRSAQSFEQKDAACGRLKWIGTAHCVPALAALLTDDALSHSARYALESMPGPEASQALLQALAKTTGSNEVGIIHSLAFRRVAEAGPVLGGLLDNPDSAVAVAAAAGLGRIGGSQSIDFLKAAAPRSSGPLHTAEIDSLLVCGNRYLSIGNKTDAEEIFQGIYDHEKGETIRVAAFRGLIQASNEKAIPLLAGAIAGADAPSQGAALQLASRMPGAAVTKALTDLLPTAPAPVQIALLQCFAMRGDTAAAEFISPLVDSSDGDVRLAAIPALSALGDEKAVLVLAKRAASTKGAEQDAARRALVDLRHGMVTDALLNLASGGPLGLRLEAIRALGDRGDAAAEPKMLQLAHNDDAIAAAAFHALALLASPAQISAMINLVVTAKNDDARLAAADALASICQRYGSQNGQWDVRLLADAAGTGPLEARLALLPVCGELAAAPIREVLRGALQDSEPRVREAAIRAMSATRDAQLLPDLLKLAAGADEKRFRVLALRACVRLATQEDGAKLSNSDKVAALKKMLDTPLEAPEKRVVLSGLGSIPDDRALALATPFLDDDAVRPEAAQAVIHIAGSIWKARPAEAGEALKKVLAMQINPATRQSAEAAIKKIQ